MLAPTVKARKALPRISQARLVVARLVLGCTVGEGIRAC